MTYDPESGHKNIFADTSKAKGPDRSGPLY